MPAADLENPGLAPHPDNSNLYQRSERLRSYDLCAQGALIGIDPATMQGVVIPMLCKSWACPRCRKKKTRQWTAIAIDGKPERFITLTCDRDRFASVEHAFQVMAKAFSKLVARIRRKFGSFEYIRVWELHKSGYPHLHIMQRGGYIPQKWLSETWDELGVGKIVDIRKIHRPQVTAAYVTKYMGKGLAVLSEKFRGLRLIVKSGGWLTQEQKAADEPQTKNCRWGWLSVPYDQVLSDLGSCGIVETGYNARTLIVDIDARGYHRSASVIYTELFRCIDRIIHPPPAETPPDEF